MWVSMVLALGLRSADKTWGASFVKSSLPGPKLDHFIPFMPRATSANPNGPALKATG